MTQPLTGSSWAGAGLNDIDPRLLERGGLQAVIVRDYRGADTDISPFEDDGVTVNFSPFAQDGTIRDDLLAARLVNGVWTVNPNPNEGFVYVGANAEDGGPERNPNTTSDDLFVLQSKFPYDSDITEKGKTISFTMVDTLKPLVHALENDLPINDPDTGALALKALGAANYFVGSRLDTKTVDRQILMFFAKDVEGLPLYRVEAVPRCRLDNQDAKNRTKTDPDAVTLDFKVLPDTYFVIPDPDGSGKLVPGFDGVWIGGPAWDAFAGGGS